MTAHVQVKTSTIYFHCLQNSRKRADGLWEKFDNFAVNHENVTTEERFPIIVPLVCSDGPA